MSFVANEGRWDPRATWVAPGSEATAYFVEGGVRWALAGRGDQPGWVLDQTLLGARAGRPSASVPAAGLVNFFGGGQSHAGLATANELTMAQAWPGVDVVWSGAAGKIEATYRLAPGADPGQVRVNWGGAEMLAVTAAGRLRVTTPVRTFEEDEPKAFQDVEGTRVPVEVSFELDGAVGYGFRLGQYDPALPLLIDPTTLLYATFLGGSGADGSGGIAVDATGNAYVSGSSTSASATFPETTGVLQAENAGGFADAFVAKLNPTGSALVYATFLGGSGLENCNGIAVDAAGNAYITGETTSTPTSDGVTFPVTPGAFQTEVPGSDAAYVAKLNPTGSALVYASFLGGSGDTEGSRIAVDTAGNAYVTGVTDSNAATFPETPGVFQPENGGSAFLSDAFVAKVNPTGSALVYASFLGGSDTDFANGLAVDAAGNAYITGQTKSTAATFPVTAGAFQAENAGGFFDSFVVKVNPTASALVYASFLGGNGDDGGFGIAVDGAGNAHIAGYSTDVPHFSLTLWPPMFVARSTLAAAGWLRGDCLTEQDLACRS